MKTLRTAEADLNRIIMNSPFAADDVTGILKSQIRRLFQGKFTSPATPPDPWTEFIVESAPVRGAEMPERDS